MIVPDTDIPRNSQTPLDPARLAWLDWQSMAMGASRILAKSNAHCGAPPETMPSAGVMQEARAALNPRTQGLINASAQLTVAVTGQQVHGATVDDSGDAPEFVPYVSVPSAEGRPVAPLRMKQRRHVTQPGVPWGSPSAADTIGPCATGVTAASLQDRIKAHPWRFLLLAVGGVAVVYSAVDG